MWKSIIICFCLWSISVAAFKINPRVVGGEDIDIAAAPYQVAIFNMGEFACGGAVIGKRTILTAAHCTNKYNIADIVVLAGTSNLETPDRNHFYFASLVNTHPEYDKKNLKNDIGIIILQDEIRFDIGHVDIIDSSSIDVPLGAKLYLTGFGSKAANFPTSDQLQGITVTAVNEEFCRKTFPSLIHGNQICTFDGIGRGSCGGDSGGPLTYKGHIVGVVSFGRACAVGVGDVYTSVAHFQEYIMIFLDQYG